MYDFTYIRPNNINEAMQALKSGEAQLVAGGQSLLPTMKQRLAKTDKLIDIRHLQGLDSISDNGATLQIGALASHHNVAESTIVQKSIPALAQLANGIGDMHVRNLGTMGGSIANNDPAACYPSACLGLKATIATANNQNMTADNFFNGLFTTALDENDIITAVNFTKPECASYQKFRQPASLFALVGVFVAKFKEGARVAVTGAGEDGVFRHNDLEKALSDNFTATACDSVCVSSDGLIGDIHGSAAYRAHLIKILTQRAVQACSHG